MTLTLVRESEPRKNQLNADYLEAKRAVSEPARSLQPGDPLLEACRELGAAIALRLARRGGA
jgi:hypothetical protein